MGDNPFAGAKRGDHFKWRDNKTGAFRELVVVEHDHELWVAFDHGLYSKIDDFPVTAALWKGGKFRKVVA